MRQQHKVWERAWRHRVMCTKAVRGRGMDYKTADVKLSGTVDTLMGTWKWIAWLRPWERPDGQIVDWRVGRLHVWQGRQHTKSVGDDWAIWDGRWDDDSPQARGAGMVVLGTLTSFVDSWNLGVE